MLNSIQKTYYPNIYTVGQQLLLSYTWMTITQSSRMSVYFLKNVRTGPIGTMYTKTAAGEGKIRVRCLDKHKIRGKIRYPPQPTQLPSDQYYSISLLSPPTTSCRSNWMSAYNRAGGTGWVGLEFAHSILGGLSMFLPKHFIGDRKLIF